jgi:hypothetical protein
LNERRSPSGWNIATPLHRAAARLDGDSGNLARQAQRFSAAQAQRTFAAHAVEAALDDEIERNLISRGRLLKHVDR